MPINEEHRKKRTKNYLLLGILVLVMAGLYGVAVLKIKALDGGIGL